MWDKKVPLLHNPMFCYPVGHPADFVRFTK